MKDSGGAGVELALAVGLLMIPSAILVLSFGPWSEAKVTAESIAAEAARGAVLSLSTEPASQVAIAAARTSGVDIEHLRVGYCGSPAQQPFGGWCSFERGTSVIVTVEIWTPTVATPWGPVGGLWVRGHHSEPIDLYRSLP